jgi:D-alanyl-lipoteichoic acid acyltransferase DltB (MBOAT superfamily)
MLFNTVEFFVFFPVVTILYFTLPHRYRWGLLLVASCYFYIRFIPAYILILFLTISIDYIAGIAIENSRDGRRKLFLVASILANIGVLAIFKYFNFMNDNLEAVFGFLGWKYPITALEIIFSYIPILELHNRSVSRCPKSRKKSGHFRPLRDVLSPIGGRSHRTSTEHAPSVS